MKRTIKLSIGDTSRHRSLAVNLRSKSAVEVYIELPATYPAQAERGRRSS